MANDAPRPQSLFPPSPISQANASSILSAGGSLSTKINTDSTEDQAMQDIEASGAGEGGRVTAKKQEFEDDDDKTVSIEDVGGVEPGSGMKTGCEEEDEEESGSEGGNEDEDSEGSHQLVDEQTFEELRKIWDKFDQNQRQPFDDFVASAARWSIEAVCQMLVEAKQDQRVVLEDEEFRKDWNNKQSWIGAENGLEELVALQLESAKDRLEVEREKDRFKSWKLLPDAGAHHFIFQTSELNEALFDNLRRDVTDCEDCFLMLCLPTFEDGKDTLAKMMCWLTPSPTQKLKKIDVVVGTDLNLQLDSWASLKALDRLFDVEGSGFFPFFLGNLDFIPIEYKVWYMVINRVTGLVTVGLAVGSGERDEENPRKGLNSYDLGVRFVYDGRSPTSQLYDFVRGMSETFSNQYSAGELFMPTSTISGLQQRSLLDEKHYYATSLLWRLDKAAKHQALRFAEVPNANLYEFHQRRLRGSQFYRYDKLAQTKTKEQEEEYNKRKG